MPAVKGTRIYRCQLDACGIEDLVNPVGVIIQKENNPKILGFRNLTNDIMTGITPSGRSKEIKPNEIIPVKNGIRLTIYGKTMEFQNNDSEGEGMK